MKPSSISGLACYVEDLDETAAFYEALGFRAGKREANQITYYVNWFSIVFMLGSAPDKLDFRDEADVELKGQGVFFSVKVDDVDAYYRGALDAGMKPLTEPHDVHNGNREFVLRDPDGYKLAIFQKK